MVRREVKQINEGGLRSYLVTISIVVSLLLSTGGIIGNFILTPYRLGEVEKEVDLNTDGRHEMDGHFARFDERLKNLEDDVKTLPSDLKEALREALGKK